MEFRTQEPVDEMGIASTPPLAYASSAAAASAHFPKPSGNGGAAGPPPQAPAPEVRYHECLRNHAAALGGHVVDGCGEFMPTPGDDPLKCAACGCHRSFHRKDPSPDDHHRLLLAATSAHRVPAPSTPAPRLPLLLPTPHHYSGHPHPSFPYHTPSGSGGTTTESSSEERGPAAAQAHGGQVLRRKRFRTKFTQEQKEQMLGFAERVGWRLQKQDEALVEQFCSQVGVRRQVLKVWMHNNKHNNTRRQQQQHQMLQEQQSQQQQQQ